MFCRVFILLLCSIESKPELQNDCQPIELVETSHLDSQHTETVPLMSSKDKLKCRKVKAVLRYHVANSNRHVEEYTNHLLFSFYPFRNEEHLKYPYNVFCKVPTTRCIRYN